MNPSDPYRHLEPVPPESSLPVEEPYRVGEHLYLPETARLPLDLCVCCGRPAIRAVRKAVRHPGNPMTWYTRQPVIEIGLCKRHTDDHRVAVALTYSLMVIGVILLVTGAITMHLPTLIIGGATAAVSGLFRARKPVWGTWAGSDHVCLRGCAGRYLAVIPQREES